MSILAWIIVGSGSRGSAKMWITRSSASPSIRRGRWSKTVTSTGQRLHRPPISTPVNLDDPRESYRWVQLSSTNEGARAVLLIPRTASRRRPQSSKSGSPSSTNHIGKSRSASVGQDGLVNGWRLPPKEPDRPLAETLDSASSRKNSSRGIRGIELEGFGPGVETFSCAGPSRLVY